MKRHATAVWNGSGKDGNGTLSTQSTVLQNTQYSYKSRFEDGVGTNPEELIAAAHAGCFTMKLSFVLGAAGFTPDRIDTDCTITLENGVITTSHLQVTATVPGISKEEFDKAAQEAEKECPVSKALKLEISMEAKLNEAMVAG
jgi:osmotically inducible protein OsmC